MWMTPNGIHLSRETMDRFLCSRESYCLAASLAVAVELCTIKRGSIFIPSANETVAMVFVKWEAEAGLWVSLSPPLPY